MPWLVLRLSSSCVLVRRVVLSWRAACLRMWMPQCATGSWSAWLRNSSRCVCLLAQCQQHVHSGLQVPGVPTNRACALS